MASNQEAQSALNAVGLCMPPRQTSYGPCGYRTELEVSYVLVTSSAQDTMCNLTLVGCSSFPGVLPALHLSMPQILLLSPLVSLHFLGRGWEWGKMGRQHGVGWAGEQSLGKWLEECCSLHVAH